MARKKKTTITLDEMPAHDHGGFNRKRTEAADEILEELFDEVVEEPIVPKRYKIADANRLRLTLEKGTLENTEFDGVTIEGSDIRTVSFKGCSVKDTTFKNVIMQGCNMSEADATGNTFINCDLRWGLKPEGFEGNNTFINTRL